MSASFRPGGGGNRHYRHFDGRLGVEQQVCAVGRVSVVAQLVSYEVPQVLSVVVVVMLAGSMP